MFNFNLFKNDRKTDGDNQPLYKNATFVLDEDVTLVAGQKYEIALWKKEQTKDGRPADFCSVSVKENNFSVTTKIEPEVEQAPF